MFPVRNIFLRNQKLYINGSLTYLAQILTIEM